MKLFFYFVIVGLMCLSLEAEEINISTKSPSYPSVIAPEAQKLNQINYLEELIAASERNLEKQKKIKTQLQEFVNLHEAFSQDTNNKPLGLKMIRSAQALLEQIKSAHLVHVFDPDFIGELTVFSNIASKGPILRP